MFKKGEQVTYKSEFSDDPQNEFVYTVINELEKGRLDIRATNSNLQLPPLEVVKPEWIKHI